MKENKIIIITTILNFIVAVLKLISGLAFSFSTLIADSVQSFIDWVSIERIRVRKMQKMMRTRILSPMIIDARAGQIRRFIWAISRKRAT